MNPGPVRTTVHGNLLILVQAAQDYWFWVR